MTGLLRHESIHLIFDTGKDAEKRSLGGGSAGNAGSAVTTTVTTATTATAITTTTSTAITTATATTAVTTISSTALLGALSLVEEPFGMDTEGGGHVGSLGPEIGGKVSV